MANKMKGLPPSFDLDVKPRSSEPLDWGSYLDEDAAPASVVTMPRRAEGALERGQQGRAATGPSDSSPARAAARRAASSGAREEEFAGTLEEADDDRPAERRPSLRQGRNNPRAAAPRLRPVPTPTAPRPKRKQVNMKPETLDVFEDLLDHVRERGAQRDIFASDLMDALVLAASNARADLDLSTLKPRGRWGTESAIAFRAALRAAIEQAIAKRSTKSAVSSEGGERLEG